MDFETNEQQTSAAKSSLCAANQLLLGIPILQVILLIFLPEIFTDGITLLGFIGIPLLYVHLKLGGSFKQVFKLRAVKLKAFLPLTLIAVAIQPVSTLLFMISRSIFGDHLGFLLEDLFNKPSLILFFTLCIVPALGEEFFLRGIVLHLYKPLKWPVQVIANGFLFGIFHQNLNQFSYCLFIGMVLALVVIVTKSIWSGVWIHFLNNFLSFLESQFNFTILNFEFNVIINWLLIILLSAISLWLIYWLFIWLNRYYSDSPLIETLEAEDKAWVEANQCEKLHWKHMFTVSLWVQMVIFAILSTVIIFGAKGL